MKNKVDLDSAKDLYEGGAVYALAEKVPSMIDELRELREQNLRMHHAIKKAQEFCKLQKPESSYQLDWAVDAAKRKVLQHLKEAHID